MNTLATLVDTQTLAAFTVVGVTVLLFGRCALRKARGAKSCGDGCSCPVSKTREVLIRK